MKKIFTVEGMSCSACSASVEKAVSRLQFVKTAEVNLLAKTLICDYPYTAENTAKIISTVEKAGFSAFLKEEKNKAEASSGKGTPKSNMTARLTLSVIFSFVIMYIGMGHMLRLPLTDWISSHENIVLNGILQLVFCVVVLILNRSFFIRGFKALFKGNANMDSLVAIGVTASVVYSLYILLQAGINIGSVMSHEIHFYFDSAAMVLTLVTVGKALEERSKQKTGDALESLTELAPKFANCIINGVETKVKLEDLAVGDIFLVRPGERIAADGTVIEGNSAVDESALTGESMPVEKTVGDSIFTACTNLNGALTVRAEKVGQQTTLSHIIELVEAAGASKAPVARLADKISGIFVPTVMIISLITFLGWLIFGSDIGFALACAVSVLVISCPCALGLATPVAMTVSMGTSASKGILIKNAETIEILQKINTVIFDKTGTLTKGKPRVTDVFWADSKEELLSLAFSLESKSEHPLAKAINDYCVQNNIELKEITNFHSVTGSGIEGYIDSEYCIAGTVDFLTKNGISCEMLSKQANVLQSEGKTVLFFAKSGKLTGIVAVSDEIREQSADTIEILKKNKIHTVMLTGDNKTVAEAVGNAVGIDEIVSEVKPDEKEEIVKKAQQRGQFVLMVGDGINDSPALSRADVGCAMGNGTEIAIDSADMVLLHNNPLHIPEQISYSKRTMRNIKQNLFWAFFYNALGIPVAAGLLYSFSGFLLNPMICAAAMCFSSLFVVSNALRLKINRKKEL